MYMRIEENWKSAPGFLQGVEVSDRGNVRLNYGDSTEDVTLHVASNGYVSINLLGKHALVHRLVAEAFIPNPDNKFFVVHKDGDNSNNSADNLEWASGAENHYYSVKQNKRSAGKSIRCVQTGVVFGSLVAASIYFGIPEQVIDECCKENKKCFGYDFEYVNNIEDDASTVVVIPMSCVKDNCDKFESIEEFRKSYFPMLK